MSATHTQSTTVSGVLHLAFEMGEDRWKLFFTTGIAQNPRIRSIPVGDFKALEAEIAKAKKRFGLPDDAPVVSCYEAGREGFYVHRMLLSLNIQNIVVDSASLEVDRRQRRAKSDRIDGTKLVQMLVRHRNGETKVLRIVHAPTFEEEQNRHLHRHLNLLKAERLALSNGIKAQLLLVGIRQVDVSKLAELMPTLRCYNGQPLPDDLRSRLLRDFERWQLVDRQIKDLENDRKRRIRNDSTPNVSKIRLLLMLKGIGLCGSWLLVQEVFGWRKFSNRKQVGSHPGLTPTPYDSGNSKREQGISKAGNAQVRWMMVELAWSWVRYQPNSELTQWYRARWDQNSRLRKIGIVAVARRLMIALWRYVEHGTLPKGAEVVDWRDKLKGTAQVA